MTSDEIREIFLSFFAERGHRRLPSASLLPAAYDPSVLLTTAGMHPLKPYFQGLEEPPAPRLTSCQKCFRTPDIDNVGRTARHLTFFEMLGNFSLGDYSKEQATAFAWELSRSGFGFSADDIWVTVFAGDEELGLGADEEAIAAWQRLGVAPERIVPCPRSENFWQAGPSGPCGPCSELYLDRGLKWGAADDLPGGENERFLEYWNLVFMEFDQQLDADGRPQLTPLPQRNVDTGLGLSRMAMIQQDVDTVFETDQFAPLIALGRSLIGTGAASNAAESEVLRALRILADHTRGMAFLIADGIVPSNEERGYVLRRLMRRAIAQGHRLGFKPGFLPAYVEVVEQTMGAAYPELGRERDTILRWVRGEEESFGQTLEHGLRLLEDLLAEGQIAGDDAFRLHDTFGFPIDLTEEIAAERGVTVDRAGFDRAMDAQRKRSVAGAQGGGRVGAQQELVLSVSRQPSEFTGYSSLREHTTVLGSERGPDGTTVIKLANSPFYAQGGGQVADGGTIVADGGGEPMVVTSVIRAGDDQAVMIAGERQITTGAAVIATVDRAARVATQANHTATHLLHAALRERLGTHVRQAGSYVGPDKLRFDFTHGERLSAADLHAVEDRVNEWIARADPIRPITTTLDEARRLGAMALFGEKYGDVVRMVQIGAGDYSRELCGGTHVRSTAEIGVFRILSEGSSASNVRRIEAVTGPEAVALLRSHDAIVRALALDLRVAPTAVADKVAKLRVQAQAAAATAGGAQTVNIDELTAAATTIAGVAVVATVVDGLGGKALREVADRVKDRLGDGAVVLGSVADGKVSLVAAAGPAVIERGVRAGEIVAIAAPIVGGGGGGRDTIAQAGGRDPERLKDAIAAARDAISRILTG